MVFFYWLFFGVEKLQKIDLLFVENLEFWDHSDLQKNKINKTGKKLMRNPSSEKMSFGAGLISHHEDMQVTRENGMK